MEDQIQPGDFMVNKDGGGAPPPVKAADRLPGIPSKSIWAVLGWSLLTLGIYSYFWLGLRVKHFNRLNSTAKMRLGPIVFSAISLTLAPIFMDLPPGKPSLGTLMVCVAAWVINLVGLVLFYRQLFKARRAMMDHLAAFDTPEINVSKISALWTFLFWIFYLQFRINWAATEDEPDTVA